MSKFESTIRSLKTAFETAHENMAEDERLSKEFEEKHHNAAIIRVYEWQRPGLTINKDKILPNDLAHLDYSPRPTGGGIVFHAPGDILFTLVFTKDDPAFPKALKEKTKVISDTVQRALNAIDIEAEVTNGSTELIGDNASQKQNLQFCKTYDTPFELSVDDEKICGITLKRYRHHFLVQGILHLQSNVDAFPDIPEEYYDYLTPGMSQLDINPEALRDVLLEQFQRLFHS